MNDENSLWVGLNIRETELYVKQKRPQERVSFLHCSAHPGGISNPERERLEKLKINKNLRKKQASNSRR